MEGIKLLRMQTIGDHAVLLISDSWLYAKEFEDYVVLYKKPTMLISTDPCELIVDYNEAMEKGYGFLVVEETDKRSCFPLEKIRRVFLDTEKWISAEAEEGRNKP